MNRGDTKPFAIECSCLSESGGRTVSSFDGVIRFMASKVRIISDDSIEFLGPSVSDGMLVEEVYGSQDAIHLF
jgi:hypothetical protein